MKISQLLSGIDITLNNQENDFIKKYNNVKLESLNEHEHWIAQNLVRRGIYKLSNDDQTLIKNLHEQN